MRSEIGKLVKINANEQSPKLIAVQTKKQTNRSPYPWYRSDIDSLNSSTTDFQNKIDFS